MKKGDIIFLIYSDGTAKVDDPRIVTKVYESGNNLALIKPVNGGQSTTIQKGEFVTLKDLLSSPSEDEILKGYDTWVIESKVRDQMIAFWAGIDFARRNFNNRLS